MASQAIENGKPVDTSATGNASSSSSSAAKNKGTSSLDKDAFLQLLVAQMRYQDPLQPTDNTEYIAQLATFSQLEATQNLQDTMTKELGTNLVGKHVILYPTDPITGKSQYVSGKVDYTMVENGEVYLSVEDRIYNIEDLDSIVDSEYFEASQMVKTFSGMMGKLPAVKTLTIQDEGKLTEARKYYDAMTKYQQKFVTAQDLEKLEKLEEKMKELTKDRPTEPPKEEGE